MPELLGQSDSADEQWSVYLLSQRGLYRRAFLLAASIFVGAGAGAASGPLWNGEIHRFTPATSKLVASGLVALCIVATSMAIVLARKMASVRPPIRPPRPRGRGAYLLREVMSGYRRGAIMFQSIFLLVFAFVASHGPTASALIWIALTLLYGALLLAMCFVRFRREGELDEFSAAMRGRAAQIGFWTATTILACVTLATTIYGVSVMRLLPLAFAVVVAAPCWAFVTLTHSPEHDG